MFSKKECYFGGFTSDYNSFAIEFFSFSIIHFSIKYLFLNILE